MIVETLEPVWSGELEARGLVPGLSTYMGPSSIRVISEERAAALEYGECGKLRSAVTDDEVRAALAAGGHCLAIAERLGTGYKRVLTLARQWGLTQARYTLTPEREAAIVAVLRRGVTYKALERDYGVPIGVARRLVREHGIARVRSGEAA